MFASFNSNMKNWTETDYVYVETTEFTLEIMF